jgi:hypothetical protein
VKCENCGSDDTIVFYHHKFNDFHEHLRKLVCFCNYCGSSKEKVEVV